MIDIHQIEEYLKTLREEELKFKNGVTHNVEEIKKKNFLLRLVDNFWFSAKSMLDFIELKIRLQHSGFREKRIVYTAYNFTNRVDGVVEDRIVKPLFSNNIIFINQSKEKWVGEINNQKVYNTGGVVKLVSLFMKPDTRTMKLFLAYQKVNKWILSIYQSKDIYLMWFYDLNSLAISFSDYRHKLNLIEVQHGSIINYPPYIHPSPVKLIDEFYVKNTPTINYLKEHLCRGFDCKYHLIPYPKGNRKKAEGVHILYASTVDFKGLHPVFADFLRNTSIKDLHIQVRLHPRERVPEIEDLFTKQITETGRSFVFDKSKNWLEDNTVENLIVVSPWSSSIEDSFDNGYTTIVIDPSGKKRFEHIIDDVTCFYSDTLDDTIQLILNS